MINLRQLFAVMAILVFCQPSLGHAQSEKTTTEAQRYVGVWRGEYKCAQGPTAAIMILRTGGPGEPGEVFGEVAFSTSKTSGCYAVWGAVEEGQDALRLHGRRWFNQPDFYTMATWLGALMQGGAYFEGALERKDCEGFSLKRAAAPHLARREAEAICKKR